MTEETAALIAQDLLGIKKELRKLTGGVKVVHVYSEQSYKIVIERPASARGVIGVKVEANADSVDEVLRNAKTLFTDAIAYADPSFVPEGATLKT